MKKLILIAFLAMGICAFAQDGLKEYNAMRFTWGASFGSDIDLTGNDKSDVSLDAYFGIRFAGVQVLGVGAGIDVPVSNSWRSYPVYMIMRTNFMKRPSLCFFDLRGGASVNLLEYDHKQTGAYVSAGVGFQLASSSKFSSHLILAYSYFGRDDYEHGQDKIRMHDLHMATMRIGIAF
ncbi:MAG: hypothetical protein NC102_04675 [Clostridium sp.]|nr:hypothetical protein [Clostridium sp.]